MIGGERYRRSREAAVAQVSEILAVLENERQDREISHWCNRFAVIARVLDDRELNDEQAVVAAAELVDKLYSGGQSIADFYLVRTGFGEQSMLNARFEQGLDLLRKTMGPDSHRAHCP